MKKFLLSLSILLSAAAFTGCNDFFDPETDDMLPGDEYISSDMEMYSGILGVLTKMQAIGDKELLLTETRGELVDLTNRSTPEITAVFNYADDLTGNSYADPAPYYELIIACNDYLSKMRDYRNVYGVDQEMWKNLVSTVIRTKAWTYKTLVEIYGEAIWFDSPVTSLSEVNEANGFHLLSLEQVVDKALDLMINGWEGVPADRQVDFIAMFDPANVTSPASSVYRVWNYSTLPYEGVLAELLLWKGAALDSRGADSQAVYQQCADLVLTRLQKEFATNNQSDRTYWLICTASKSRWDKLFSYRNNFDQLETVACLLYDYEHDQTHSINKHFLATGVNLYQLKPSDAGIDRWYDADFNPGAAASDSRFTSTINNRGAQNYICKFSRTSDLVSYDDVAIILYRATQYHFYLMEALNHLKRYTPVNYMLNNGVDVMLGTETDHEHDFLLDPQWAGFNEYWTKTNPGNNYKSGSQGVRGMQSVPARHIVMEPGDEDMTDAEAIRYNDMQLLNECILEFAAEGRNYAVMNRMALRYNDLGIVADLVCPKYEAVGMAADVRAKILSGGNYVKYDLLFQGNGETPSTPDDATTEE